MTKEQIIQGSINRIAAKISDLEQELNALSSEGVRTAIEINERKYHGRTHYALKVEFWEYRRLSNNDKPDIFGE